METMLIEYLLPNGRVRRRLCTFVVDDPEPVELPPPQPRETDGHNHRSRELLSTLQAAHFLGLAVPTLAKWRTAGLAPPFHKLGRRIVYRRDDLEAWLASQKRSSTSEYPVVAKRGARK